MPDEADPDAGPPDDAETDPGDDTQADGEPDGTSDYDSGGEPTDGPADEGAVDADAAETAVDADRGEGPDINREDTSQSAETDPRPAASNDDPRPDAPADDQAPTDTDTEPPEGAGQTTAGGAPPDGPTPGSSVPEDVRKYDRFQKIDGGTYERANDFLRERTYITAREWAIARLCADFRTETGVEMTKIGENLPELVPFMTDTYTPQAVNQARHSFEEKIRKAGATFLYGAMCDFFTAEELDDVMYEATEVAKFLLEVEGVDLSVEEELEAEDRISGVMREVREHSAALRHDEVTCPECGHHIQADE
ncbi:DUF5806 family protein [Halobacteriales archaeon Cl-PHB]